MIRKNIDNATLEAIYWWNRDEFFYHNYFSKIDEIVKKEETLDFFTKKIFEVFLREYSVRRNISKGSDSVKRFIEELFKYDFIKSVKLGDTEVIDSLSSILKENQYSTKKNTKSLLSKVAFLINPYDFYLYDSLAKYSIWDIQKSETRIVRSQLENYSTFITQVEILKERIEDKGLLNNSQNILSKFDGSDAHTFFSTSDNAFKMRIIDKYLWLYAQHKNDNTINNNGYFEIYKKK
jgi:hypothetical protein